MMTTEPSGVIGGVDTHKHSHRAAVIDPAGRFLGDRGFGTDSQGEVDLLAWLRSHGPVAAVGIEGSGSYGASLARRWLALDAEIKMLDRRIKRLVEHTAPDLVELCGVGAEIAGQLLVTAGDNPERIRTEAAFAKLCGVAPQPASSGRTTGRHRLSRSGDRAANSALYMIVITRIRHHQPTRAYLERRTAEGLTKREIIRCLKRYVAREVFKALPAKPALDKTQEHRAVQPDPRRRIPIRIQIQIRTRPPTPTPDLGPQLQSPQAPH